MAYQGMQQSEYRGQLAVLKTHWHDISENAPLSARATFVLQTRKGYLARGGCWGRGSWLSRILRAVGGRGSGRRQRREAQGRGAVLQGAADDLVAGGQRGGQLQLALPPLIQRVIHRIQVQLRRSI